MTELVAKVVKTPVKFLINQARTAVAKSLIHGDEGDRGIANVIMPEAERTKMSLNAIKQTNLRASVNFYFEGVESIAFDAVDSPQPPIKRRQISVLTKALHRGK